MRHTQYVGQTVDVLWETAVGADKDGLRWVGYTDNYIRVQQIESNDMDLEHRLSTVKLERVSDDASMMYAKVLD